ncbi:MAG: hypothetical protein K2Q22_09300 [Cytophagales bacterium]|nr:hypothetical protein [Cytophagales bacterium]
MLGGKGASAPVQSQSQAPTTPAPPVVTPAIPRVNLSIAMEGFNFHYDNMRISPRDVSRVMIKNGVPEAAKEFDRGLKFYPSASRPLIGIGVPFFLAGTLLSIVGGGIISTAERNYASYPSSFSSYEDSINIGSALMGVGIPVGVLGLGSWITGAVIKGVGLKKIRNSVDKYNASIK